MYKVELSRLLIYASYKDADVIIWIAEEFDDEHWRTLKWLNRRTESRTRFFGVAVEVLSIDGSPPAPHFRVIVAPEDWRLGKPRRTSRREYPEFWQGLDQKLKQNGLCVEYNEEDYTNAWFTVDFTDGLRYVFDSRDGFSLALQLDTRGSERSLQWCPAFDLLEQHKECIEKQVGGTFVWDRKWQSDWGSQIISHCPLAYYDLIESSEELHEWAVKQYSRFRDVFDNYRTELKNLKLD